MTGIRPVVVRVLVAQRLCFETLMASICSEIQTGHESSSDTSRSKQARAPLRALTRRRPFGDCYSPVGPAAGDLKGDWLYHALCH